MLVYKSTHQRGRGGIGHDGLDKSGGRVLCKLDWQLDGAFPSPTKHLHILQHFQAQKGLDND